MRNISQTIFNIDKMENRRYLVSYLSIQKGNQRNRSCNQLISPYTSTGRISYPTVIYPQGFISVIAKPYKTIQS